MYVSSSENQPWIQGNSDTEDFAENIEVVNRIRPNVRECCVGEIIYHASPCSRITHVHAPFWTRHARRSGYEGWDGRDFSTSRNRKFVEDAWNHGTTRRAKHQLASFFCLSRSLSFSQWTPLRGGPRRGMTEDEGFYPTLAFDKKWESVKIDASVILALCRVTGH